MTRACHNRRPLRNAATILIALAVGCAPPTGSDATGSPDGPSLVVGGKADGNGSRAIPLSISIVSEDRLTQIRAGRSELQTVDDFDALVQAATRHAREEEAEGAVAGRSEELAATVALPIVALAVSSGAAMIMTTRGAQSGTDVATGRWDDRLFDIDWSLEPSDLHFGLSEAIQSMADAINGPEEVTSLTPDGQLLWTGVLQPSLQRILNDAQSEVDSDELDEDGCGTPWIDSTSALRRKPYVQSVRPNSARIAWTTKSRGEGWVEFVESPGEDSAWRDAPANSQLFKKKKTGDKKKYRAYEASLDTLAPDTWYCYRVKEDGETLASGLAFHTSWIGGYRPLRILAFGDTGTRHQAQYDIRDRIAEMDFDVMLHTGDIAYPKGSHRQFEKNFFNIYNPTTPEQGLLHRVPVFPVIGNNDYKTKMGEPFQDVFYLPEVAARPQDQELYYSFDYGNVHFVALDSNKQLRQSGGLQPMLGWLEADLASTPQPWKIAYFHHPPFTSVPGEAKTEVARHLVPVLERHGVDLVLMGHVHGYERTEPIRIDAAGNATADEEGIPYVVTGGGGGVDEPTGATASHVTEVFADNQPHFMQLTVTGCDMVGLAIDPQGALVDSFHLRGCD